MPLPSSVTFGSVALVVVAGVSLAVVAASDATESHQAQTNTTAMTSGHVTRDPAGHSRRGAHHSARHQRHAEVVVPKVLVEVYNNTGVSGLAAREAGRIEAAGWTVSATDNWYGNIPATTVYFPPALRPAAAKLAKVIHVTRLHPAVPPMSFDRLTVIIAAP
ncbi:MAG: LytR C-terminal domain-containing protein [Nocardioidaceae bacterium]